MNLLWPRPSVGAQAWGSATVLCHGARAVQLTPGHKKPAVLPWVLCENPSGDRYGILKSLLLQLVVSVYLLS